MRNRSLKRKKLRFQYWLEQRLGPLKKKGLGPLLAFGGLTLVVLGFILVVILFTWYARDLPSPGEVVRREGFTTKIYDRNEKLLYDVYREANRVPVVAEDVPRYLKEATVAIEDKDFWTHQGFDRKTPFRILYNLFAKRRLVGGSTLTQQLVKNVLLTSERKVSRKVKEFILAVQIERRYSKEDILLMYLNEAPYGGTAWGVGTAAQQYFSKEVNELNLVESAFLAGLPQRPSVYSPFSGNKEAYIFRTGDVLRRMREDAYIDEDQEKQAKEQLGQLSFKGGKSSIEAPHFVFWVKNLLAEKFGEELVEGGGLRVKTSLDLDLQIVAEKIVGEEMEKAADLGISNAAMLVMDPETGEVLAMLGSKDYFSEEIDGKFNVVTALRQPGSAIKPVTYLTALKQGYTLSSMVVDAPVSFAGTVGQKDYAPENYSGDFWGPMQLRQALGNSINVTAVKTLAQVGLSSMLQTAYEMGFSTLAPSPENLSRFGLSVTLGGGEVKLIDMATAYSTLANGGKKTEPVGVLQVEDSRGKKMYEFKPISGERVVGEEEAWLISDALADNKARSLTFGEVNRLIIPGKKVAVKTGTTNDKRDNWCVGWNPSLLVAVWVGNNDNSPMGRVASGVSGATPIWQRVMTEGLKSRPTTDWAQPGGVVMAEVDTVSGYRSHDGFLARQEYFVKGTEPSGNDPVHVKLKVCRDKEGLAPPSAVAGGNFDEREFIVLQEKDPVSVDGRNRWQEGIDKWIEGQGDNRYRPPKNYCSNEGWLKIFIDEPEHESTVGNKFQVKIRSDSVEKVVEVRLFANGKEVKTWTEKPFEAKIELEDGTYELHVEAKDEKGNEAGGEIRIGVNKPWDWSPSPTLGPTNTPVLSTPTLIPTLTFFPTFVPTP